MEDLTFALWECQVTSLFHWRVVQICNIVILMTRMIGHPPQCRTRCSTGRYQPERRVWRQPMRNWWFIYKSQPQSYIEKTNLLFCSFDLSSHSIPAPLILTWFSLDTRFSMIALQVLWTHEVTYKTSINSEQKAPRKKSYKMFGFIACPIWEWCSPRKVIPSHS